MAVNVFGVTHQMLRATYFAHLGDFSAYSTPTDTVVTQEVARKAAYLEGRLRKEAIDAASVTDSSSSAYLICQELLLLAAAIGLSGLMTGQSPEWLRALELRLERRYRELDDDGWTALGTPQPQEEPDGPNTHIDAHNLELEDEADISPLTHKLRARDML